MVKQKQKQITTKALFLQKKREPPQQMAVVLRFHVCSFPLQPQVTPSLQELPPAELIRLALAAKSHAAEGQVGVSDMTKPPRIPRKTNNRGLPKKNKTTQKGFSPPQKKKKTTGGYQKNPKKGGLSQDQKKTVWTLGGALGGRG